MQKIISESGIASRRQSEKIIREGRVSVNGHTITTMGYRSDPQKSKIRIDGKLISNDLKKIYILLYKPKNYITSLKDPEGRPTVIDLLKKIPVRVFPVGRLDFDAEGLLLLTNDGDFAQRLIHPKFAIPRTYLVKVKGFPDVSTIKTLRSGVHLSDGITFPAKVILLRKSDKNSWLKITVTEGRNNLIKRMLRSVGHPVIKLKLIAFGPFTWGKLKPGY
ncbi:MAG: rRNA pseudouridine synthase [Desulfobacterota bacterium]|nr:rRNA pseudouridine synthase [Thermodesulfobacteriota bacterium]